MDEPKIKFGDKFFLYGQYMEQERWDEYGFHSPIYNAVMGYMPFGGYLINPLKTDMNGASLPGFVVDFLPSPSLTAATPFADEEVVEVTDLLALSSPYLQGSKVWMPTGVLQKQQHRTLPLLFI